MQTRKYVRTQERILYVYVRFWITWSFRPFLRIYYHRVLRSYFRTRVRRIPVVFFFKRFFFFLIYKSPRIRLYIRLLSVKRRLTTFAAILEKDEEEEEEKKKYTHTVRTIRLRIYTCNICKKKKNNNLYL